MYDGYQHVVEEVLQSDSREGGTVTPWVKADIVLVEYPPRRRCFVRRARLPGMAARRTTRTTINTVSKITANVLKKFSLDGALPGARPSGQR
jgi:N,N-dimethylformamidase